MKSDPDDKVLSIDIGGSRIKGTILDMTGKMLRDYVRIDTPSSAEPEDIMQADEFWQIIRKKSRNLQEYIVVYASFSLDLSPREILAEYPGVFSDIKEIYQHKANLLDRLERDEEIKNFILR